MTRLPNDRIKVVCYFPSFDGLFLESAFLDLCVHARNLFYNWFSANKVSRVKLHIYECLKSQENPTEIITVNNFPFLNRTLEIVMFGTKIRHLMMLPIFQIFMTKFWLVVTRIQR